MGLGSWVSDTRASVDTELKLLCDSYHQLLEAAIVKSSDAARFNEATVQVQGAAILSASDRLLELASAISVQAMVLDRNLHEEVAAEQRLFADAAAAAQKAGAE